MRIKSVRSVCGSCQAMPDMYFGNEKPQDLHFPIGTIGQEDLGLFHAEDIIFDILPQRFDID